MPSLEEAIDDKYGAECFDCMTTSITIYVPKVNPRSLIPTLLVLNDCDIDTAGSESLAEKCQDVLELDLAQNRLNSWQQISHILQSMPQLNFVNLSFNNLSEELSDIKTYPLLKNLVLNSTRVSWSTVQMLLNFLPGLEELHLSFNDFHNVNLCDNGKAICHEKIRKLHFTEKITQGTYNAVIYVLVGYTFPTHLLQVSLCAVLNLIVWELTSKQHLSDLQQVLVNNVSLLSVPVCERFLKTGNPIECWSEISNLGKAFPSLDYLVLSECPIKALNLGELGEDAHQYFHNLKFLNLNYTCLMSWDDVDHLGKFPSLECLRLHDIPLFESSQYTEYERRQFLIARLGNVRVLNGGGPIGHDEREDAERAFIRHYMERPESDRPERYSELSLKHGKLDPLVNVDLSPEKKVTVTFTCKDLSETRSLFLYQTVSELKQKLDGFGGIPSRRMRMFYIDQDMKNIHGPEEMRFPNKQLYSYNISNGDEILIESKLLSCKSCPN